MKAPDDLPDDVAALEAALIARNLHDVDRSCVRIDHPRGNQEGRLITNPQGQMPAAIVKLVGNYDCRPSEQRVKWIGDLYFASQIPGTMTPRRTAADSAPRRCTA